MNVAVAVPARTPTVGPDPSPVLLQMYRVSQQPASSHWAFQRWAFEQVNALVPFHSASWINGVMQGQVPVFHEVFSHNLKPGYWETLQSLVLLDPLGPQMFSFPGTSFVTGHEDFPVRMVQEWLVPYEVRHAISGMMADPSTGVFSVVCWHRSADMPLFSETDRLLHQQLLPHWVHCLNAHRVTQTLTDLHRVARDGHWAALAEPNGLLHYAQAGFGERLQAEFPGWSGGCLPASLLKVLALDDAATAGHIGSRAGASVVHIGQRLVAERQPTPSGLWLVHIREITPRDGLTPREREVAQLLGEGLSVKSAARSLGIAPATVDNLRASAYHKLKVHNRASLAAVLGVARSHSHSEGD